MSAGARKTRAGEHPCIRQTTVNTMVTIITVGSGFCRGSTTVTGGTMAAVGWAATVTFCADNI